MPKVKATVHFTDVEGDFGTHEGVEVVCEKCGHSEESGGTGDASIARCAMLLRENCPRGEHNYYETDV